MTSLVIRELLGKNCDDTSLHPLKKPTVNKKDDNYWQGCEKK